MLRDATARNGEPAVKWLRVSGLSTVGVLAAAGIVVAGVDHGASTQSMRLLSGSAWLASPTVGQLTLLDGSSGEVAAQVQVAPAGDVVDAVQQGHTGYGVDRTDGTIRRVDGATFELSQPQAPIPGAKSGLVAFAGPSHLYVMDTARGVYTTADPQTLARQGDPVSLSARPTAGGTALDEAGRLWLIDEATGDLVRVDGRTSSTFRGVAAKGTKVLAVANDRPVIVNSDERTATVVDSGGRVTGKIQLDLRDGDALQVTGSPHADRLYLVAGRGLLTICELGEAACDTSIPLTGGSTFGPAVEANNRLFVPDYTTGQVWIVSLADRTVVKTEALVPQTKFQLIARDGVVFFNDLESERAGVIHLDGTVSKTAKYDRANPGKGLTPPPPTDSPTVPPTPSPNPPPTEQPPPSPPPTTAPPTTSPNQPPTQSPTPPPPTTEPTPNPPNPPPKPELRITLSNANPTVDDEVTVQVSATVGGPLTAAEWDLGDGQRASGLAATHRWTTARTYQVSVVATAADGQQASTSLSLTVAPPVPVTVPNVVGQTEAAARNTITAANLAPTVTRVVNNTVPAGVVISQSPAGGTKVAPQSAVALTVSSGKRPTVDLITAGSGAAWRSGAGTLPFNGSDGDSRGFALVRTGPYEFGGSGPCVLEDGTAPRYLETHPQWVTGGFIEGVYTLPSPVIPGDHFRSRVGFIKCQNLGQIGRVRFSVRIIRPDGTEVQVTQVADIGSNATMHNIDIDLTPHAGATRIKLRVDDTGDSQQDWASWVAPRIEG
jgi:hypothetical protein